MPTKRCLRFWNPSETLRRSGLLTRNPATESASLRVRTKKLTAFVELESVIKKALKAEKEP
jgi:hypothetical protein